MELENSIEKINDELRDAENADIKLKTHNISTETELEKIAVTDINKILQTTMAKNVRLKESLLLR